MKNCPKCNSENIKEKPAFARTIYDGQKPEEQSEQTVTYTCLDCGNALSVKFNETTE